MSWGQKRGQRLVGRLTAAKIKAARQDGKYPDGRGLVLVVRAGRGAWHFRYTRAGKEHVLSLGPSDAISLAKARELHHEARSVLLSGKDPIEERRRTKADLSHTLASAVAAYLAAHSPKWRHPATGKQWANSLANHVLPAIGKTPIAEIDVHHVLRVLKPIWTELPETASKIRGRLELVIDYAIASGWRVNSNPAIWRGSLKALLPAKSAIHETKHHAALPWEECPALWDALQQRPNLASACLAFLLLTAVRSNEARGARWDEVDLHNAVWSIPATRMKMRQVHRVPLSSAALAILRRMAEIRGSDLVFPGHKRGKLLTDVTLKEQLRALGHDDITVHGFRSSFRDWCGETGRPGDAAEIALAHTVGTTVTRAYARSDLLELRRTLMQAWSDHLTGSVVVPLRVAS